MATITAANSVFTLTVLPIFPVPQQLQGYATDDAFASDAVQPAEVQMGVDGRMSAGWIPTVTPMTVTLQADSTSNFLFEQWDQGQKLIREIMFATGQIDLPSIGRSYVFTRGVLTSLQRVTGAKKVLQQRPYIITWESATAVPL